MPETQRSWLSLLGFFAVITLGSSLIFAAVFAGVTAVIAGGGSAQASDDQQQVDPIVPAQTFTGIITDSHCNGRHADPKRSAAECTRICVSNGSKYLLVDGDKNYEIAGDSAQISQLAGQRVRLTGALAGGRIKVTSATALATDGTNPPSM